MHFTLVFTFVVELTFGNVFQYPSFILSIDEDTIEHHSILINIKLLHIAFILKMRN